MNAGPTAVESGPLRGRETWLGGAETRGYSVLYRCDRNMMGIPYIVDEWPSRQGSGIVIIGEESKDPANLRRTHMESERRVGKVIAEGGLASSVRADLVNVIEPAMTSLQLIDSSTLHMAQRPTCHCHTTQ